MWRISRTFRSWFKIKILVCLWIIVAVQHIIVNYFNLMIWLIHFFSFFRHRNCRLIRSTNYLADLVKRWCKWSHVSCENIHLFLEEIRLCLFQSVCIWDCLLINIRELLLKHLIPLFSITLVISVLLLVVNKPISFVFYSIVFFALFSRRFHMLIMMLSCSMEISCPTFFSFND